MGKLMVRGSRLIAAVVSIVFIGLLCLSRSQLSRFVDSLNPSVTASIIAGIVGVILLILGKLIESRMLIRKEHREKKAPVYECLITFVLKMLLDSQKGLPLNEEDLENFMTDTIQKLTVWGSDEVVIAFLRWMRHIRNGSAQTSKPHEALYLVEELVFAIRQDLGHANRNLAKKDLLSMFIHDIDTLN